MLGRIPIFSDQSFDNNSNDVAIFFFSFGPNIPLWVKVTSFESITTHQEFF